MAKLVITYENGVIEKELTFAGKNYSYRMVDDEFGKTSDNKSFEYQVEEAFEEVDDEVLEALETLDFGDDDDVEEALRILSLWEN